MTRDEFVGRMKDSKYFKLDNKTCEDGRLSWHYSKDIDNIMFVGLLEDDAILVLLDFPAISLERVYNLQDLAYSESPKEIYARGGTLSIKLE